VEPEKKKQFNLFSSSRLRNEMETIWGVNAKKNFNAFSPSLIFHCGEQTIFLVLLQEGYLHERHC
jgi:hypothetical protein